MSPVLVVGIAADGWASLSPAVQDRVLSSDVLLGGARHLEMVPPVEGQVRRAWPSPLRAALPSLLQELEGRSVVVLASGDPLVSGIATTLQSVGVSVSVEPAVSSVALARARMGWPSDSHATVSLVGRDVALVARELAPGRRILVLSSDEHTPAALASLLVGHGYGSSRLTVLNDLGSPAEGRTEVVAEDCRGPFARLNIVAVEAFGTSVCSSWAPGLPDEAFENDGQLTKRDLRAAALSRLMPQPGQLLWDVGAGAGSVGIEWMRAHPTCRTIAVEGSPERAARILRNAATLGVPTLEVVEGRAPAALDGLDRPHAVFVGGGATRPGVLEACREALLPGGRLVVHGVTLETEAALAAAYSTHGGELVRISVETAAPLGTFTGWTPARAVTQWTWVKP